MRSKSSLHTDSDDKLLLSRVFAELASFIENDVEHGNYIFKLSLLHSFYIDRLCSLGIKKDINKNTSAQKVQAHYIYVLQWH